MKTICIETKPDASIGGGVRLLNESNIYTSYPYLIDDPIRKKNLQRFNKDVIKLTKNELYNVLEEENNIQIISNDGTSGIKGLYPNPKTHPILLKSGIIGICLSSPKLIDYIPKSIIISKETINENNIINKIIDTISQNYLYGEEKFVIKHSKIDGNGYGVGILDIKNYKEQIQNILNKFSLKLLKKENLYSYDYIIQEFIGNILGEGSITFSIQNNQIENWGLANNVVINGEYFGSTNFFAYITIQEQQNIIKQLENDLLPILKELQIQGIRGNVGFDIMFKKLNGIIKVYILECNGIHRTTGSTMPNSFAYNTQNKIYIGLPIAKKYLSSKYQEMNNKTLINISNILQGFGTELSKEQIINLKCDGFEWGYPVLWIAIAGNSQKELVKLFFETGLTNDLGNIYISNIFKHMNI